MGGDQRTRRPRHKQGLVDDHTPYEDDIVCRLFVEMHPNGATLNAVGAMFNLSRERVRQIEERALCKLLAVVHAEGLELPSDAGDVLAVALGAGRKHL